MLLHLYEFLNYLFLTDQYHVLQKMIHYNYGQFYREIMGATDPKNAKDGTIRKLYGISIDKNSVHGSDSVENAKIEISFFFNK